MTFAISTVIVQTSINDDDDDFDDKLKYIVWWDIVFQHMEIKYKSWRMMGVIDWMLSGKFKFIHAGFCVRLNYELLYDFNAIVYMAMACKSIRLFVVLYWGCSKLSKKIEFFKCHKKKFSANRIWWRLFRHVIKIYAMFLFSIPVWCANFDALRWTWRLFFQPAWIRKIVISGSFLCLKLFSDFNIKFLETLRLSVRNRIYFERMFDIHNAKVDKAKLKEWTSWMTCIMHERTEHFHIEIIFRE